MPLDMNALAAQIAAMSNDQRTMFDEVAATRAAVRGRYRAAVGDEAAWGRVAEDSQTRWRLAAPAPLPGESFTTVQPPPPAPPDYSVLATDGSQEAMNRHGVADCYLINIGLAMLRYGDQPSARLFSVPTLYYHEDDLYLTARDQTWRYHVEDTFLSARRDVAELTAAADAATTADAAAPPRTSPALPRMVLQDGTLLRFWLESADDDLRARLLDPYLDGLNTLRAAGIPVASYISKTSSAEVTGLARLMHCPDVDVAGGRGAICKRCSDTRAGRVPSCRVCDDSNDASLHAMLGEGERSMLFHSLSGVNRWYGEHRIHFFYMRVGREVARVEMPQWVATDAAQVARVHALVYDQCVRGNGYPVVLARAHDEAVLRSDDRATFQRMVERQMQRYGAGSAKQGSKQFPAA